MRTFLIAHKELLFTPPSNTEVIWTGPRSECTICEQKVHFLQDVSDELYAWHPFLANSAGNFAIEALLRNSYYSQNESVSIITYRKFFSNSVLDDSTPSTGVPGMQIIEGKKLEKYSIDKIHSDLRKPFLFARPIIFENLYSQYLLWDQNGADFLRYLALAVELGIIQDRETPDVMNSNIFIPGGCELGVMPIDVYLEVIEKLRQISGAFLKNHSVMVINPIRRRSIASCNEVMGSYLLFRDHLSLECVTLNCFGVLNCVVPNNATDYAPGRAL